MTDIRYRKLLWLYVALMLAAIVSAFFPMYSEDLAVAYSNEPETWLMRNPWIYGGMLGGLLVAWLTGLIGLFRFKAWARSLSLYVTLAGFFAYPFMGPSVLSGLESALFDAVSTIWGGILALSYFSAVSERFER
jgi:LytS/YehU family sensor histidine kinase